MSHDRYTLTGSPDGVIRLWASGDAFVRAKALPAASASAATTASESGVSSGASELTAAEDGSAVVQGAHFALSS